MRLLILSIEFPPGPGGIGTLAYQAARCLSDIGWHVQVLTPQDHVDQPAIERFDASLSFEVRHISHVEPPMWEGIRRLAIALQAVRSCRPDVVLAVGKQAVWLGAMLSLLTGLPLVAVGVGSEFGGGSLANRLTNRYAFGAARQVIAISQYTWQLILDAGVSLAKIIVVPCGADADLFCPGLETDELRADLGLGRCRVILSVGQLSERKAQDVVIRALPRILQVNPDVVYVLVGIPTRQKELARLAESLGIGDHVVFAGQVAIDKLPYYYNLADLFVLASRRTAKGEVEGYGIVAAEASLCGLPVVVSRNCGFAEDAIDGKTALLVTPDDSLEVANVIVRLLADDHLSTEMGRAARRHILGTATWVRRMQVYSNILKTVARGA